MLTPWYQPICCSRTGRSWIVSGLATQTRGDTWTLPRDTGLCTSCSGCCRPSHHSYQWPRQHRAPCCDQTILVNQRQIQHTEICWKPKICLWNFHVFINYELYLIRYLYCRSYSSLLLHSRREWVEQNYSSSPYTSMSGIKIRFSEFAVQRNHESFNLKP